MEAEVQTRPVDTVHRQVSLARPAADLEPLPRLVPRPEIDAPVRRPLALAEAAAIIVLLNLFGWGLVVGGVQLLFG